MSYVHRSYDVKQPYLLPRVLEQVRSDIEDGIIGSQGAESGLLIEITCPGACISTVQQRITVEWIADNAFGAILQRHCVEFRVYDLHAVSPGIAIRFSPEQPYEIAAHRPSPH